MSVRLHFHGAAREVTGSLHLVECNGSIVLLDCGLFQGRRAEANAKNRSLPRSSADISAVVLSHAHIDHCGKLPRLVRAGFSGPIYATPSTCDLTAILLADSAHIQEEDAEYWNKKRVRRGDAPIEPLYTADDVDPTVDLLRPIPLGTEFHVADGVRATMHDAGHMLGSAGMTLALDGGQGRPVRLVYTGDVGRPNLAILRDPAPLPDCDYLIGESTYGGRQTPDAQGTREKFAAIVNRTVERGGKVIVPAFAVGRTQVVAYYYNSALHDGLIKKAVPLIVDSPLASKATDVFRRHPEDYDEEATVFRREAGGLFRGKWCDFTESVEDSKALHKRKEPMIIVSASGMCEVGRILHHLKNNIEDPHSTIVIVGYQAAHTLGRRLVEKQKKVKIFGETYDVRARVEVLNGFSAHADASDLADLYKPLAPSVRRAFLVHGEPDQQETLAGHMREQGFTEVRIPQPGDVCELT